MFHQLIAGLTLGFFLLGCQGAKKKGEVKASNLELPSGYTSPKVFQLTGVGVNWSPQISPNGLQLVFISSKRPSHEGSQVYLKNLENDSEKRITYHDGDTGYVAFSPNGKRLLYSSTTDEQKEKSNFIKDSLKRITGHPKSKEFKDSTHHFGLKTLWRFTLVFSMERELSA